MASRPDLLFAAACMVLLAGSGLGFLIGRRRPRAGARLALACAFAGGVLAIWGGIGFWRAPFPQTSLLQLTPAIGAKGSTFPAIHLDIYVDHLASFFIVLTGALVVGVSLYSWTWLEGKHQPHRVAGTYCLFVLFALLLLVANNAYVFLLVLECLTLIFSYLTLYRHNVLLEQNESQIREDEMAQAKLAFKTYLIVSHIGMAFILTAFLVLAVSANEFEFERLRILGRCKGFSTAGFVFVLALLGFGIKTAAFPSQFWMSLTHPYLPTNVHALVSAVIIKIAGLYGLMRVLFDFLQPFIQPWWAAVTLLAAGATAVVGVFYAITSRDLKTALANHSVENIGIMLAGIGVALLGNRSLAILGLVAALYHLLNHSVFKSLLFLATGAIEDRTGTVEMEKLGGLLTRLPWTAVTFLVGAVAIAGFPPFNGFVSEWLTLQALIAALYFAPTLLSRLGVVAAILTLGLAFGLTAMAFVKITGETLLGAPRNAKIASHIKEGPEPWPMRAVLVVLAVLCLLLGLLPGLIMQPLETIARELLNPLSTPWQLSSPTSLAAAIGTAESYYTIGLDMIPLLLLGLAPVVLLAATRRRHARGRRPVWAGGDEYDSEDTQITGGALSFMIWEWSAVRFADPGRRRRLGKEGKGDAPEQERLPWRLALSATYFVREYFRWGLSGFLSRVLLAAQRFGAGFQSGHIRNYLIYLFVLFILVLLFILARPVLTQH